MLIQCPSCHGQCTFWNNCHSPGEPEWYTCTECDGEGEIEVEEE